MVYETHTKERKRRIAAMWRRFCRLARKESPTRAASLVRAEGNARLAVMRRGVSKFPEAFHLESALEGGDIAIMDFTPSIGGEPTNALPGTPEKVSVLARRAATGKELWHPCDNQGTES